ncbi:RING-H2 finger protein [Amycolatopsis sp. SID8362]|uniref:RING finger protein n=1 Tax=Amycolatopsis sp. SID8362 TaxID=2690346 RepID=UPI00136DE5AE|nr:RING-H2 finger protein [Amycolatopsis sp. SID8362]NBH04284.1 hypothetical protein [Amycolatopsis sp. SID8362]NED40983.1 E3 ubiquitin protein ligase [Amycolatopsis sp. SID8362]
MLDYLTETYQSADQRMIAVAELANEPIVARWLAPESVRRQGPGWWRARDAATREWRYLRSDARPDDPNTAGLNWLGRDEFVVARGRFFEPEGVRWHRAGWWRAIDESTNRPWFLHRDGRPEDPNAAGLNWITWDEFVAAWGRFDPARVEQPRAGWWRVIDESTGEWRFLHSDARPEDPNAADLNWITPDEFVAASGRFDPARVERHGAGWWRADHGGTGRPWYLRGDTRPEDPNAADLNWLDWDGFLAARGRFDPERVERHGPGWWRALDGATMDWRFLHSNVRPEDPNAAGLNWVTEAEYRAWFSNPTSSPAQVSQTYPLGEAPAYDDLPSGVSVTLTAGGAIRAGQAQVATCAICQEVFTVDEVAQPAGGCPHYFHWACLAAWAYPSNALVQYNPNDPRAFPQCPTCRGTLRSRPGDTPELKPLKIFVAAEFGLRSDDGKYWWDGTTWQPVTDTPDPQPSPSMQPAPEPVSAEDAVNYVIDAYRDSAPDSDARRSLFYRSGETDFIRDVTITLPADATGTPDRAVFTIRSDPSTTESGETFWQLDLTGVTADGHSVDSSAWLCANPATRTAYITLTL